jgi:DMSO/TMAO reductase YedYZ molybdopterin-dependent catalytic subunit
MSFSINLHLSQAPKACWMISCLCCALLSPFLVKKALSQETSILVRGEVKSELSLSLTDLKALPSFLVRDVPVIPERVRDRKDEERVSQTTFRGVLLRDVLYKAGMKYKRKWEPGTFVRVRNAEGKEVLFSFGEIFYSSIGRSVLIAYERDERPCVPTLVVATDIHDGRMMTNISEITAVRVEVELLAYDDQAKKVVRPPTTEFTLFDKAGKAQHVIKPADLKSLPATHVPNAVLIGDCEGFHGIHSLDGVPLAALLKKYLTIPDPDPYNRYVLISSDDGYCATFSFGELFNSRLGDQVVIATVKDGKPLSPADGFAMSITGEDSTGGRSVRRIKKIEVQ